MPQQAPLWISEADVVSMMSMGEAIPALEKGLLAEAKREAENMVKTHVEWNGSTLHAIGATFPKAGFSGTKTWAHTKGGATPLLILFDSANGSLKAVIEAFALGQMRTAAASGVATQRLAAPDADDFAILGTGKQAIAQVAAVLAVRPIRRLRVYSPTEEHRRQFVARVKKEFAIDAVEAASVREALNEAAIVTVVTRATKPIVTSDMIARGTHINAVGAIVPNRAELAADVIARATQIVADSVEQAQRLSRELIEFFRADPGQWNTVRPLARLVASPYARGPEDDVTLFKSLGMGISDLSLGIELYSKALELGLGREFPHPQKVAPRLRANEPANSIAGG